MQTDLADLCRQLRLAHVVEYVAHQQDKQISRWVEELLTAELDGRRRSKLGKLVQQAGFPHIKTLKDMSTTTFRFQVKAVRTCSGISDGWSDKKTCC